MPFISELKVVGDLHLQDLKTTVTVHLIRLEGLTETNLVYLSHSPITSPPRHLNFTSPDGQTKPGDVLLWASERIPNRRGSCGRVHQCWMYDGKEWIKRHDLRSSVNQVQHPVHSDHRLVVSSGPFIEWELKPAQYYNDSDSESSSTSDSAAVLAHLDGQTTPIASSMIMKGLQGTITSESDLEEIERSICATKNKTPISSVELSSSRLESLEITSPSRLQKTNRRNASRKHREPQLEESLKKTADIRKGHRDPTSFIHVKRPRPSSPSPLSRKQRKTTNNPDEPKLETTLQHPEDSSSSVVAAPLPSSPPTCGATSSSQAHTVGAATQAGGHGIAPSRETVSTAENYLATRGADQGQKGAFSIGHAMIDEVEQLRQALGAQKTRVCDLEVSLGAAKKDLSAQKIEAKKREEASQKELDLVTEELGKKNQLAIRLADEVDLVKLRMEELQEALATSANELQIQKDRAAHVEEAVEMAQRLGKDLQDWISELEAQQRRDQEIIIATQANLSKAQVMAAQYRRDISAQKVTLLKEMRCRKSLRQKVKTNAERRAQEMLKRIMLEKELENQKAEFREYLAISDRERGKVEQQFLGQKAFSELNLETTTRGLASMEAKCSKLKDEYTAEVLELKNAIRSSKTALEYSQREATAKQEAAEHEMTVLRCRIADLTRDLEAAGLEMAKMISVVSDERDKLQQLRVNETRLGQELSNLREQLAQENGERGKIEKECEILKRDIGERSLLLEEAQATCLRLTAESSSLQDRHVAELSQRQVVYEGKIQTLVQELENMRTSHSATLREIVGLRREVKDGLVNNADMKQKIKEVQSLLETKVSENMALQDQHAKALASERWKRENTEKILEAVKEECREPFVIPMLLDCFVGAHKEASYLSGSEDGEVHES